MASSSSEVYLMPGKSSIVDYTEAAIESEMESVLMMELYDVQFSRSGIEYTESKSTSSL